MVVFERSGISECKISLYSEELEVVDDSEYLRIGLEGW